MGDNISTVGDSFSTVEGIQYIGGQHQCMWGETSVQWGDNISTVEGIQYSGGITSVQWRITSVLRRLLSTVEIKI